MNYKRGEVKQNLPVFYFRAVNYILLYPGKQPCFRKSKIHLHEKYIVLPQALCFTSFYIV